MKPCQGGASLLDTNAPYWLQFQFTLPGYRTAVIAARGYFPLYPSEPPMPKISAEARVSRRLRFRDLHVFLAVVECGSMGKAAVQLGTTQPSVSELISGLESTIGARLFDRNAQGVEPTLYGQALSKRAIAAFDELKQGLRDLEYLANPTIGEIRIGCPDSVSSTILPTMITRFCREFPGIALRFD